MMLSWQMTPFGRSSEPPSPAFPFRDILHFGQLCGFSQDAMQHLGTSAGILAAFPDSAKTLAICKQQLFEGGNPWPSLQELSRRSRLPRYTLDLLFLLSCGADSELRYLKAGLSRQIFRDSIKDLCCKSEETHALYGIWGIYCGPWSAGLLTMRCICLGRLQFEPMESDYSCRIGRHVLQKGQPVLNVHIPAFGKLNYEAVCRSYRQAAAHFRSRFPDGPVWFRCESWLLYPQVNAMLPIGNMRRFSEDYTLVHACIDPMQDDRYRVFHVPETIPPSQYPEENSLQKALKQWLLAGNQMGVGFGFLVWDRDKI